MKSDYPINAFIFGFETGSQTRPGFASAEMVFSAYLLVFWTIILITSSGFPFILYHRVRNELFFQFQIKDSLKIHFVYGKISIKQIGKETTEGGVGERSALFEIMCSAAALPILKTIFGFDGFLPGQIEAISAVIDGDDVVVRLPTNGGSQSAS